MFFDIFLTKKPTTWGCRARPAKKRSKGYCVVVVAEGCGDTLLESSGEVDGPSAKLRWLSLESRAQKQAKNNQIICNVCYN